MVRVALKTMRWGSLLAVVALLLGAVPAPAQESPGTMPEIKQRAAAAKPAGNALVNAIGGWFSGFMPN